MKITLFSKSFYFNPWRGHSLHTTPIKTLCSFLALITLGCIGYKLTSLLGRVKKIPPPTQPVFLHSSNEEATQRSSAALPTLPINEEAIQVRNYPGDLTEEQKKGFRIEEKAQQLHMTYREKNIFIIQGDIFASGATAIVNAANTHLGGGGGIDGLIHQYGGKDYKTAHTKLREMYRGQYTCGHAAMISSGDLCKKGFEHVIVVAGPQPPVTQATSNALYSCYYNSLVLADQQKIEKIAFPSISTGIFKYPPDEAAAVSLRAITDFITKHPNTPTKTISIHFLPKGDRVANPLELYKRACNPA